MKISDYMVDLLSAAGVKRIWGVTGDSLNGLVDSMRKQGQIEWVGTRHEEVAAFAAGAEAGITGELAVCAGSCGPGNMHLMNGLYNCYRNHTPVLAIASDIPSSEVGTDYFQETDPVYLYKECSVYCQKITNPEQMPQILETAMRQAILKRGVATIVVPGDVLEMDMPKGVGIKWQKPELPHYSASADELAKLSEMLNNSEHITFFCGAGCKDAREEVIALAKKLKAPIVHAFRGKEYMEYDNPNDMGMTGLLGFESGYHALENADTVLLLGTGFPFRAFYPKNARIIQIDIDPGALGRHTQIDLGIVADIKETVSALLPLVKENDNEVFLDNCLKHYKKTRADFDSKADIKPGDKRIHPQTLFKMMSDKANSDAIFTFDVGTPTLWSARFLKIGKDRRLLGSFHHGSMANAMPMALGAQIVDRNRQVIAMCGDGGFSMLMGDFLSLVEHKLPVKIVVLNNSCLSFVNIEMIAAGYLSTATDMVNPSFAAIADACGVKGFKATEPENLSNTIDEFLAHDGPALLEVITDKNEIGMPPKVTNEQRKGFAIYMLKAVFNGHGNQLIDIAKTNLRR
ncbi:pyruvate dehydrogenase [Actinobacillus delphinicola]|uniref:Acetohydroxy acid synthase II large subunit n=1 Tax=Actinobacillus delphinicola TaxID=51161 RepID=A0A448TU32_9PAST|nr:ubiquinone-dependent pyruvate dehydrogenase [Actinobacillus delphinicola]MDG6897409.1 pyruvate dehydrogenase [Actinobacillus delphinicola]VEJ09425.1 acetohydroxy acid synthase II large subunit [Actinobacillus delphinicola]